jgi:hypothetical protein
MNPAGSSDGRDSPSDGLASDESQPIDVNAMVENLRQTLGERPALEKTANENAKKFFKAIDKVNKNVAKNNKKHHKKLRKSLGKFMDDMRKEISSASHGTGTSAASTTHTNPDDQQQQQQQGLWQGSREAAALYELNPSHSMNFAGKKLWFLGSPHKSVDLTTVSPETRKAVVANKAAITRFVPVTKPSLSDRTCIFTKKSKQALE